MHLSKITSSSCKWCETKQLNDFKTVSVYLRPIPLRSKFASPLTLTLPRKVVYIDWKNVNWNNIGETIMDAVKQGYNVVILCFWLSTTGAADILSTWTTLSNEQAQNILDSVHANGAILLAGGFGSTDYPYNLNPVTVGTQFGEFAVNQGFDGVDCDLEGFGTGFTAGTMNGAETTTWVETLTHTIRGIIGVDRYLSHSPQQPYLCQAWVGNAQQGYLGIMTGSVSSEIDWCNCQIYNQGIGNYSTYETVFLESTQDFPNSAFNQIYTLYGIPLQKIVLTLLNCVEDGGANYQEPSTVHDWIVQSGTDIGYNAGVSVWAYGTCINNSNSGIFIQTVYPSVAMSVNTSHCGSHHRKHHHKDNHKDNHKHNNGKNIKEVSKNRGVTRK